MFFRKIMMAQDGAPGVSTAAQVAGAVAAGFAEGAAGGTPAAVQPAAPAPAAAPVAAAAPTVPKVKGKDIATADGNDKPWLKERLEKARKQASTDALEQEAKALGYQTYAEMKTDIAATKAEKDKAKPAQKRLEDALAAEREARIKAEQQANRATSDLNRERAEMKKQSAEGRLRAIASAVGRINDPMAQDLAIRKCVEWAKANPDGDVETFFANGALDRLRDPVAAPAPAGAKGPAATIPPPAPVAPGSGGNGTKDVMSMSDKEFKEHIQNYGYTGRLVV